MDNPTYKLDVNGLIRGTVVAPSDVRWKRDILSLPTPLDTVSQLRGVSYEWRHDEFPKQDFPAGRQIGLIAQEVEQIAPELVFTDPNGKKAVYYQSIAPLLIEAVKELSQTNEILMNRIEALENAL